MIGLVAMSLPWILGRLHSWGQVGFVAGVLAAWWAARAGWERLRVYRSKGWPTCDGAVEKVAMRKVDGGLNGVNYWKVSFDYRYVAKEEHVRSYAFNCVSEAMGDGAVAGLEGRTVRVHFSPADEGKGIVWEDEVWDVWWDTYWARKEKADIGAESLQE